MEPLEKLFKKIESYNNNKIKEATRIKNRRKKKT